MPVVAATTADTDGPVSSATTEKFAGELALLTTSPAPTEKLFDPSDRGLLAVSAALLYRYVRPPTVQLLEQLARETDV